MSDARADRAEPNLLQISATAWPRRTPSAPRFRPTQSHAARAPDVPHSDSSSATPALGEASFCACRRTYRTPGRHNTPHVCVIGAHFHSAALLLACGAEESLGTLIIRSVAAVGAPITTLHNT